MTPPRAMPGEGDEFELAIRDIAYGGRGVGRSETGCAVFVPGVLRGETVRVRVTATHRSFVEAELLSVSSPAPDRIEPVCPLALRALDHSAAPHPACPGCSYQHAAYASELREKDQQLDALLARVGGLTELERPAPVAAPEHLGYRNKIILHADRPADAVALGYVAADNRTIVPVEHCPLAVPPINALLTETLADTDLMQRLQPHDRLTFRATPVDGAVAWAGRARDRLDPFHEDTVFGGFVVPADSFWQVNPAIGNALMQVVHDKVNAQRPEHVVDLYCGVGPFAIAAALAGTPRVVGVDSDPRAIRAAHTNAVDRDMDNVDFRCASADDTGGTALAEGSAKQMLAVLDPPRRGLSAGLIKALTAHRPRTIIYISCAPDTLARDLKRLCRRAYRPVECRLFDMFPRTASFEALAVLEACEGHASPGRCPEL